MSKNYVELDKNNLIIAGWSNLIQPWRLALVPNAVLIGSFKGESFRLFKDGEENPDLVNSHNIPLYKWNGTKVIERSAEEIESDLAKMPTATCYGTFMTLSDVENADLNEFVSLGSRRTLSAINRPPDTSPDGFAWNILSSDALYLIQYYVDSLSVKSYRRFRINDMWTSWAAESYTAVATASLDE